MCLSHQEGADSPFLYTLHDRVDHMKLHTLYTLYPLITLTLLTACSSPSSSNQDPMSSGEDLASSALVSTCQDSCDKQRFFDCYVAAEHAQCYDDCASADEASIDKFNGCVKTTTCDAACSVHIQGKSNQVSDDDRVDTGRTPTTNASSCEMACAAMVADMCVPPSCSQACADSDLAFQVVYCDQVRSGCDFPPACGGEASPQDACKEGCQQMQFFDCITASDAIACNQSCTASATTDEARTLFADCVEAAGTCDVACYKALDPNFQPGADVEGCQQSCDQMSFFDCIDAGTLSSCRQLCTSATSTSVESFKSCNQSGCQDSSCYDAFVAAN